MDSSPLSLSRSRSPKLPTAALITSAVPARLGLKAPALAWPEGAPALSNLRPGQSRQSRPVKISSDLGEINRERVIMLPIISQYRSNNKFDTLPHQENMKLLKFYLILLNPLN